jgi:hypothetical protein
MMSLVDKIQDAMNYNGRGWSGVKVLELYAESAWFEFWLGQWLYVTGVFRGLLQFFHAEVLLVPWFIRDRFLPVSFQFTIHPSWHSTRYVALLISLWLFLFAAKQKRIFLRRVKEVRTTKT